MSTGLSASADAGLLMPAGAGFAVLVLVGAQVRLRWRRGAIPPQETHLWPGLMYGVSVLAGAVLAGQLPILAVRMGLYDLSPGTAVMLSQILFGLGALLAQAYLHQGLIHWNGRAAEIFDRGERLNLVGATLVMMSLGNGLLPVADGRRTGLDLWRLQISLAVIATGVIVVLTAMSIWGIARLKQDRRFYLVASALLVLPAPSGFALFGHTGTAMHLQILSLFAAIAIVGAAFLPPVISPIRSSTSQAAAIGSLVILLSAVAQLMVGGRLLHNTSMVTFFAAIAVAAMSLRFVQMVLDLSQLTQTRREAMTDHLTGVANRRALVKALSRALGDRDLISLLIIDLDKFKLINDRYGHAVGDELLQRVGRTFAGGLPGDALLGRLGGDEFAVLLTGPRARTATEVGARLAESLTKQMVVHGRSLRIRASIGVATNELRPHERHSVIDAPEMLRRADTAMYQAKHQRSGISVYDSELDARALEELELIEDLQALLDPVLAAQQFKVYYQPQMHLTPGGAPDGSQDGVAGVEALVRWHHPRLGLVGPDRFMELVESNGLMPALTQLVVLDVTDEWLRWRSMGLTLRASVNLSATMLSHPSLMPLLDQVAERGADPTVFTLEITETSLMVEPEVAVSALQVIAGKGFGVSIDDYGTGYSALSYLTNLPATELKIDRSFTAKMLRDPRTADIVHATVELAHRIGMRLIAEGVEDQPTLQALREMGADEVQGYLFSRALPPAEFEVWLARMFPGIFPAAASASDEPGAAAPAPEVPRVPPVFPRSGRWDVANAGS